LRVEETRNEQEKGWTFGLRSWEGIVGQRSVENTLLQQRLIDMRIDG
jgi:hypothetical protein